MLVVLGLTICARSADAGATFELDMGGGVATVHADGDNDTRAGLSMPAIAAGAWWGDRMTITGRLALMFAGDTTFVFVGPSVQFFPTRRFFIGGGIGLAGEEFDEPLPGTKITAYNGLGLDLRAGLNLRPEARHCLTLSVELTPQIYGDHQALGIALLAGYQYL
jgi:hypothetical protein